MFYTQTGAIYLGLDSLSFQASVAQGICARHALNFGYARAPRGLLFAADEVAQLVPSTMPWLAWLRQPTLPGGVFDRV